MKQRLSLVCLMLLAFVAVKAQSSLMDSPSGLTTIDIDVTQATLCWSDNDNAASWQVSYKVFQQTESTIVEVSDTVLYLQDLTSGTRYLWAVRAIDTDGDTTQWSTMQSFTTLGFDSDCPQVETLSIGGIGSNGITVQWTADIQADAWDVVAGEVGSNPNREGIVVETSNLEATVGGLTPLQRYQLAVRSNCASVVSDWRYIYAKFLPQNVLNLPIQLDFESEQNNTNIGLINSANNAWEIGQAENASSLGTKALYISNDNGLTNSCDVSVPSISYAYIDFAIPQQSVGFYIDFKYKSQTPLQGSHLRLYLVSPESSLSIADLPPVSEQIGEASYLGGQNTWTDVHIELPAYYAGLTKRILFVWENTSEASSASAVAIDDVYITARYCATPTNLRTENLSVNSAQLAWEVRDNQYSFNLEYKPVEAQQWIHLSGVTSNHLLEGLESATEYVYRVQADCVDEQSFWSNTETFTTNALIYPPQDLRLLTFNENSASIQWASDVLAQYCIVEILNSQSEEITQMQVAQNTAQIENLAQNTSYQIRVRAVSANNDTSRYSAPLYLHTLCNPIAEFPYHTTDTIKYNYQDGFCTPQDCWTVMQDTLLSPMFDLTTSSNPVLNFDFQAGENAIASLYVSTNGTSFSQLSNFVALGGNTLMLNEFMDEERVMFAFVSPREEGREYQYQILDFTIQDTCLAPEGLTINSITSTSAILEYVAYDNNTSVEFMLINPTTEDTVRQSNISNPYLMENLTPQTEYIVMLGAMCGGDSAENFSIINFSTLGEDNSCAVPSNFLCQHYQTKGDETIICTWDDDSNNPYIKWEINYKETLAVNYNVDTVSINPRFTLRNIEMGTRWEFRLRTLCPNNEVSDWTEVQTVLVGEQGLDAAEYTGASLKLYPNPTDKMIFIETSAQQIKDAQLIDTTGRVLKAWDILPNTIDVSQYPQGTYYLNVSLNGSRISKKITIK